MTHSNDSDFESWLHEKSHSAAEPEVSAEFLAAQRRAIYRRMDETQRVRPLMRWALSFAMLLALVAGGIQFEHRSKSTAPTISDEQLFSDLSAMEQRTEPKAVQPIHGLFQEQ
ncbi:MAG TPA: hypothetical protein VME17_19030 [Bryobacteraceae bacterium]|nr:hypothetical protein [Bryobacteraceae bacterium]